MQFFGYSDKVGELAEFHDFPILYPWAGHTNAWLLAGAFVEPIMITVYLYGYDIFVNTTYRKRYEVAVNAGQARAARAILKLGVREVAELAKVTANTVSRLEQDEAGPRGPQPVTVDAVKRVYEDRGIIFMDAGASPNGGPGVRFKA